MGSPRDFDEERRIWGGGGVVGEVPKEESPQGFDGERRICDGGGVVGETSNGSRRDLDDERLTCGMVGVVSKGSRGFDDERRGEGGYDSRDFEAERFGAPSKVY